MKKILIFLFLLFIPFIVNAEVKITDISFEESNFLTEDDDLPTYEGLKINLDLEFDEVEQYVVYNITVFNDTDKDYEIEESQLFDCSDFFCYEYLLPEDVSYLNSGDELPIAMLVYYETQVDPDAFVNGVYEESNSIKINLVNDDDIAPATDKNETDEAEEAQTENPKTNVSYYIIITAIVLAIALILMILNARNMAKLMIISLVVLIPITIYALDKVTIESTIKVTVKPVFYVIDEDTSEEYVYQFDLGMDFEEWVESEYNYNDFDFDDLIIGDPCDQVSDRLLYWVENEDYGDYDNYVTHYDSIIPFEYYHIHTQQMCPS